MPRTGNVHSPQNERITRRREKEIQRGTAHQIAGNYISPANKQLLPL